MTNILLTCAGRRNYIVSYFQDALYNIGGKVYAANSDIYSSALSVADKGFIVPPIYDKDYIDVIITICKDHDITVVVPLFDLELPILAKNKQKFLDHGISVIVSSLDVINIGNDKWNTNRFLSNYGLLTPKTFLDLDKVFSALKAGEINFPIMIKPRWGMGSIGLFEAENRNELSVLYSKTLKAIENSYISCINIQGQTNNVIFQEKIIGEEYGLDVINNLHGEYITTFVKRKIAMRSGETDCAITVEHPLLTRLGKKISQYLGHIANLDVDVIMCEKKPFIIEMNPRIGGGYPFSHLAGANLPKAIIAWANNLEPDPSILNVEFGVVGIKGLLPMKFSEKSI